MSATQAQIERRSTPKMGKLTIEMEPDLHRDIKVAATLARVSLREYITSAVIAKMEKTEE
jgi:predicted HicB family RNase H-like nuclease